MLDKYIFLLGREPELSIAELRSVFSEIEVFSQFAIIVADESKVQAIQESLGGTIKIAKILDASVKKEDLLDFVTAKIREKAMPWKKLRTAIDTFVPALTSLIFKAKDILKNEGCSIRVVQHEWWRVKTATTLHEKLISQGIELMLVPTPNKEGYILWETIWVQDIDAYTQRDMERNRSMVVGMMPPKIAQIMLNLATKGNFQTQIWDPFCGLGTTIIEAWNAGYRKLIASDISEEIVKMTNTNIANIKGECVVFHYDARKIDSHELQDNTCIVTEWMLGKNFNHTTISHSSVLQERKELSLLYSEFLNTAWKNNNINWIVFCMPFWNVRQDTLFMPEISELTDKWSITPLCKTKKRYLQHMRPGQCVGREIIMLNRK